ncbi:transposase [Labrys miyagiensis]
MVHDAKPRAVADEAIGRAYHAALLNTWKSFTALHINRSPGREGQVWYREYFDRKIRNEGHFEVARHYTEQNPVKARLCCRAEDRAFSSAAHWAGRSAEI